MIDLGGLQLWFVTGSQHLYGEAALQQVAADAQHIAEGLGAAEHVPVQLVSKRVLATPQGIAELCAEANADAACIGLVTWMHTFSPARMWIAGLSSLRKPLCHLHTQLERDIPWSTIDMDFMNLNQSAHGDREFGFLCSRLRRSRKVIVGHWQDPSVQERLGAWARAAAAWHDAQGMKVARFGDNMRDVAVTEGDKVEAQIRLGYSVNGYGLGDLAGHLESFDASRVDRLCREYDELYEMAAALCAGGPARDALREAARIELALRSFLEEGGFKAFTDTFENLHGLGQVPGLAVQRLMADGFGFGAEGDWKHAAMLRGLKVMGHGLPGGGASFMEDYTYHFDPEGPKVLGAHMLEVCPSIAAGRPSCEIHPLGIGGKADPVRLVFDARPGPAVNVSVVDMGNRFRMVANAVVVLEPDEPLPKLPVARAVWAPHPNLGTAAAAWIHAGGAHHTALGLGLTLEPLHDFAEIAGIEFLPIDARTDLRSFRNELRWNEAYYLGAGVRPVD